MALTAAGAFDPASVQTLIGGVDEIVIFGLPDLGRLPDIVNTPFSPTVSGLVASDNSLLQNTAAGLDACLANVAACEDNGAVWVLWDDIHPTQAVQQRVADAFADQVAPVPLSAGLPLLIGAFALIGVTSQRRKSQA